MEGFDISRILAGGAIGGIAITLVTVFWKKIKASWYYFTGLMIQRAIFSGDARIHLISYLCNHCKVSRFRDIFVKTNHCNMKVGGYSFVAFETFAAKANAIFWMGNIPVFLDSVDPKQGGSSSDDASSVCLSFIRGTVDLKDLIEKSTKEMNGMYHSNLATIVGSKKRFFIKRFPEGADATKNNKQASDTSATNASLQWYQLGYNRLLTHNVDQLGQQLSTGESALGNLFFPEHIEKMQHEIILWRSARDWYRSIGAPWKRGWLLHGTPGTGKTSLARAFAEDLDMPIFVFNLGEMGNYELRRKWMEMQANVPCIALIEDIDNVFHGRVNVVGRLGRGMDALSEMSAAVPPGFFSEGPQEADPATPATAGDDPSAQIQRARAMAGGGMGGMNTLTFDCLLNVIDGVERVEGVFVIITTNDITKVDEAIGQPAGEGGSTRPGRIDRVIELTYMTPRDKKRMAARILSKYPDELKKVIEQIDGPDEPRQSPSQFQDRCVQLALIRLWSDQKEKENAERKITAKFPPAVDDRNESGVPGQSGKLAGVA